MSRSQHQNKRQNQSGSGIVESVCGGMIILLIFLSFLDMSSVIAAQYVADSVVFNLCRVAASANSQSQATQFVNQELRQTFQPSLLVQSIRVKEVNYQSATGYGNYGKVVVQIETTVGLIVPLPFLGGQLTMQEQAALPLLANLNSSSG